MKKLLLFSLVFVLVGAGCSNVDTMTTNEVPTENEWFLTFENGDSWYPLEMYFIQGSEFGLAPERSVLPRQNRAFIQNIYAPVLPEDIQERSDLDYSDDENWIVVDVAVYPEQADMPEDVRLEELGEITIGVRERKNSNLYYWETDDYLYEMYLYTAKGNDVGWEDLFTTIKEVQLDSDG